MRVEYRILGLVSLPDTFVVFGWVMMNGFEFTEQQVLDRLIIHRLNLLT